ncbi:MAG: Fe-S cluster assembly protein SufD [Bacteroidales bacterium]|nr:Fe-S cluster assembly protein SufD [Bacteroidales bacterium]
MDSIIQQLRAIRLALRKNEVWRNVDFDDFLTDDLVSPSPDDSYEYTYRCNIPDLDTDRLALVNGYCRQPLQVLPNGIVMGGLREARRQYPDLVQRYFGSCATKTVTRSFTTMQDEAFGKGMVNSYLDINTEHYTDGLFVYIPDGVKVQKPLQFLSVIRSDRPLMLQTRNLVYVGRGSQVAIIHCDDSYDQNSSFSNNVTEIFADEGALVEHYKMQNLNAQSALLNQTYTTLQRDASLRSIAISINGGHIRNHSEIRMNGEGCETQAHGLYLIDKEEQVDNYIFVEHSHPHCHSNELFKGIMDDAARATFNGHVLVSDGAAKTEAYQSNKNILMTDKAVVNTKPFLEIYNDDVKCSHGSTIGQLDEQALFYIRSRGVSERTAKTMLLYAFCDEVIQKIAIPALRERLSDMVKKRLHGELNVCSDCALHCSTPCNGEEAGATFKIDVSKL